jgi:hypothetical protein
MAVQPGADAADDAITYVKPWGTEGSKETCE